MPAVNSWSDSPLGLTPPNAKAQKPPEQPEKKMPTLWSLQKPKAEDDNLLLESHLREPYMNYMKAQTPENADALLKHLDPVLDESLRSYGGSEAQTVTARANAKRLALEAIKRYDPERAKLRTHLLSHLRGLRRIVERSTSPVYVPEQWKIDARHVEAAYGDARDELGREPSDAELADRLKMPLERVRKARSVPGVLAASQFEGAVGTKRNDTKAWNSWVESIYHDLEPVDQVILERSFGLHGKPVLAANKIADAVKLSPGAISQRKSRIQNMLDEYDTFMGRPGG